MELGFSTCPCGSGRAFDACCHDRYRADLAAWWEMRETEARVLARVMAFSRQRWGTDVFGEAIVDFVGRSNPSPLSMAPLLPVFDCWFVFTWTPDRREDYVTVEKGWPRKPIGVVWLNGTADGIRSERRLVQAATREPLLYSPLLVETVTPGWLLVVRDMLTGRRFRIVEPEISRRVKPDLMLLSAILTFDERAFLIGTASHALPGDWRFELREERLAYRGRQWESRRFWAECPDSSFLGYRDAYKQRPVTMLHSAGAVPDPVYLQWDVSAPYQEALECLRPLTACYSHEEALDEEHGPDGEPHMLLTWYERASPERGNDWEEIGYLYLDEGRLAADVPTPALADRLIAEVASRAGHLTRLRERRPCAPVRVHDRHSSVLTMGVLKAFRPPSVSRGIH